jgi:hypothetical protein
LAAVAAARAATKKLTRTLRLQVLGLQFYRCDISDDVETRPVQRLGVWALYHRQGDGSPEACPAQVGPYAEPGTLVDGFDWSGHLMPRMAARRTKHSVLNARLSRKKPGNCRTLCCIRKIPIFSWLWMASSRLFPRCGTCTLNLSLPCCHLQRRPRLPYCVLFIVRGVFKWSVAALRICPSRDPAS